MLSLDAVYPVRKGEPNLELRYSLRSLVNLPIRDVVITGYCPRWVRPGSVLHLPRDQDRRYGPCRNVVENLALAVESDAVTDPFYLFNDDFYVMVPMEGIADHHRGPLSELLSWYSKAHHTGTYYRGLKETFAKLTDMGYVQPLAYNLHIPMLIEKEPMARAIAIGRTMQIPEIRTLYGAIAKVGGSLMETDPKRRAGHKQGDWESWPLLSSNDDYKGSGVLALLQDRFPGTSRYELD